MARPPLVSARWEGEVDADLPKRSGSTQRWARAIGNMSDLERGRWPSFPCLIDALGDQYGDAPALSSPGETLTYRGLVEAKHAYSNWAAQVGIPGQSVGLFMGNCASYVAIWLGLIQAGKPAALINTNLRGDGLRHAIETAGAGIVITDATLLPVLEDVRDSLPPGFTIWVQGAVSGGGSGVPVLDRADYAGGDTARARPSPAGTGATALLIFTSGHHGFAEGGACQPPPAPGMEPLVCRHHGHAAKRPAL